ncbi:MAG TPA: sodium-dependent transporter [Rubrobacteraceae bacterium]|nr:sodium-dependent transporter [Rubrobacteraceae bacterium]
MEAQERQRDQWGTKLGFILAAMGSAIGLGNIWRYPYVVYENGGGAFLIPYFIAIATAGIPMLILEYGLGHKYRHAAPFSYRSLSRRWEWLGWWQITVCFIIITYYIVIIGWVLSYIWYSIGTQWGSDTNAFFFEEYLGTSEGFWSVGGLRFNVLLTVAIAWAITYWLLRRGVSRGIELASKVLIPTLIVMIFVIVIRGLTLPGAGEGLNVLLTPDFGALGDPAVWVAAYGQVFFSIGVAFSIMITYSSYLPRRSDLSNSGFIVALSNSGFEFLAALGVFSVLGFLAVQQNTEVTEVATSGVGLAFVAFPQIINQLPALQSFFGLLFFGALFFAGITSAVSILEACIAGVREKFDLTRAAAVNWVCGLAALVSLLYVTRGGLYYLDTVDHFVGSNYGLLLSGLVEVILVAWVVRQVRALQRHVNERSYVRLGLWWVVALTVITPILLIVITAFNLYQELTTPYGDYPGSGLLVFGWGASLLAIVVGVILQQVRSRGSSPAGEREAL